MKEGNNCADVIKGVKSVLAIGCRKNGALDIYKVLYPDMDIDINNPLYSLPGKGEDLDYDNAKIMIIESLDSKRGLDSVL